MTDLTPLLNDLLKGHEAPPTIQQYSVSVQDLNTFLKEAYTINSLIRNLRQTLSELREPYLSTATAPRRGLNSSKTKYMTESEKEQTDAWAKRELRVLSGSIRVLSDSEEARQEADSVISRTKFSRKGLGALGKWAAGGIAPNLSDEQRLQEIKARELSEHRESILYYLRKKLQACSKDQQDMMTIRIKREILRKKSTLPDQLQAMPELGGLENAAQPPRKAAVIPESPKFDATEELSEEQIQMFERENQDMVQHHQETLNQITKAEKSLVEISELQTELVNNLATQSAHIEQLVADSFLTTENVGGGNKELKKATERKSTAKYVFYASCSLSLFLVLWDLVI